MNAPRFAPLALDLAGVRCVVVGGGPVGTRKAGSLAEAGALVTVVSPQVTDVLARETDAGRIRWLSESFREEHLRDAFLVVTATDDDAVNEQVAEASSRRGVLLCDATSSRRTRVIFGATLPVGDATVAVFTDGRDPGLARRTRDRIARLLRMQESDSGARPAVGAGVGTDGSSRQGKEPC